MDWQLGLRGLSEGGQKWNSIIDHTIRRYDALPGMNVGYFFAKAGSPVTICIVAAMSAKGH